MSMLDISSLIICETDEIKLQYSPSSVRRSTSDEKPGSPSPMEKLPSFEELMQGQGQIIQNPSLLNKMTAQRHALQHIHSAPLMPFTSPDIPNYPAAGSHYLSPYGSPDFIQTLPYGSPDFIQAQGRQQMAPAPRRISSHPSIRSEFAHLNAKLTESHGAMALATLKKPRASEGGRSSSLTSRSSLASSGSNSPHRHGLGGQRPYRRSVNTAERKHKCVWEGCTMAFPTSSELTCHVRTHTGERPYVCEYEGCHKAFAQSGGLVRHRRTHTGDRPYPCTFPDCGKAFAESGHLTRHMRSHTGEKPYYCPYNCGKAFATSYHLARHQKTHVGDMPFQCGHRDCGLVFEDAASMMAHSRQEHGSETGSDISSN